MGSQAKEMYLRGKSIILLQTVSDTITDRILIIINSL